jgi:hypothetical protein
MADGREKPRYGSGFFDGKWLSSSESAFTEVEMLLAFTP